MTSKTTNNTANSILRLSIQIGLNGLSFCTVNTLNNSVERLERHALKDVTGPEQLQQNLQSLLPEAIAQGGFREVTIIHVNELSSFVPKPFFNKNKLSDYLKFNSKILQNDFIDYDLIPNYEMVNVYVPYTNINNYCIDLFGEFEYKHFSTVLVEALLNQTKNMAAPTMYVHVQEQQFEVVVVKQKKLVLYNSFFYQTKEDFIYYILFVAEQMLLNPEEFSLYLLGDIDKESELYDILYTYVRHVNFGQQNTGFTIEGSLLKADHADFVLLNSF